MRSRESFRPDSTSTDSATSSALPTERPRGVSIALRTAVTLSPWSRPRRTIVRASSPARSLSVMKAPEPTFTSSTRDSVPSAIFFDMIDPAMSGIESTVPVTSRSA